MKEFILECYKEYVKFIDIGNNILPGINPISQNSNNQNNDKSSYAYNDDSEMGNNPINLYYSQMLCDCHKTFQKAVLFHEFTHICDETIFLSIYDKKELSSIMATYSEYHAAQIELACKVGFRNIHACYKMNLSKTFVYSENKKIKIETDYTYPASDALIIIEQPKDKYYNLDNYNYFLCYKTFEAKTMYYLGKRKFCEKYSLKKIPDLTSTWYGDFYPYVQKLEECMLNKNFKELILARKRLFEKFFSTFSFCNLPGLLNEVSFYS